VSSDLSDPALSSRIQTCRATWSGPVSASRRVRGGNFLDGQIREGESAVTVEGATKPKKIPFPKARKPSADSRLRIKTSLRLPNINRSR